MTNQTMLEGYPVPTFGRVIQLLRDLGFVEIPVKEGMLAFGHAASGAEFFFRDQPLDTLTSIRDLVNLRFQLTYRDFMTREEFNRFLTSSAHPTTATPQPTAPQ